MEKAGKIIILACAWLLTTCVTEFESVAPSTELVIYVENDSGLPINGANVYIFDDQAAFDLSVSSGSPAGFKSTTQSADGVARLSQLNSSTLYFIYVTYLDPKPYPGTFISYDNSTEKFSLKNNLEAGSLTYLRVVLKPADGFVTFWTGSANNGVLPIDVFFGTTSVGQVSQGFSSPPALSAAGALTVRTKNGTITFEGKSASGCLWTNTITLAGGQSISYQLQDCPVGTIAFYTDNTNAAKLPITLKLNANDVLPNVTAVVSAAPPDCNASNLIKAVRAPGNYTYLATSASGACTWTGSFSLSANQCKLIALPTCP